MTRAILSHTLRLHLASRAHRAVTLLMMALVVIALVRAGTALDARRDAMALAVRAAAAEWAAVPPAAWLDAGVRQGQWLYLPERAERVLAAGPQLAPSYHARVGLAPAHRLDLADGAISWTPEASAFGDLDLGFVLVVLAPLWVLFLVHDAISGEKARGTLRIVFSHAVTRRRFLLARALGVAVIVIGAFALAMLIGAAIAALRGQLAGLEVATLGLALMLAAAYLGIYVALGVWISARTASPRGSLAVLSALWVVLTFAVPRLGTAAAYAWSPSPSSLEHEVDKRRALAEARRAYVEEHHPVAGSSWMAERVLVAQQALPREAELDAAYRAARREGRTLATRLSMVSPAGIAFAAILELAAADIARHEQFIVQADDHRRAMTAHYVRAMQSDEPDGRAVLDGVPAFSFVEPSRGDVRRRVLARIAILFAMAGALLVLAVRSFHRHDLR
jgi:ABC-2 type transport system permease protein